MHTIRTESTHDLGRFHLLDELRILRVVDMGAERNVVDGALSLYSVALQSLDFVRFVQDVLHAQGKYEHTTR